jgi:hypothetical protein
MWRTIHSIKTALRCHDYKPKPLGWFSVRNWTKQFKKDRRLAERLLDNVIYISESRTRDILVDQNAALMKRLADAGLPPKKLIYVQVHDAGSSSPVMLNLLRDAANLERFGCKFVDVHDTMRLTKMMNELGEGALIYVDDFIGTGNQFCGERDYAAKNFVVNTFSEFLIAPSICEEAYYQIGTRGIEAFTGHVHDKAERPLHANSTLFKKEEKDRLELMCKGINAKFGLGYKGLATMVVLYRNAPNTVPAILRGSLNQTPFVGIFPRTTDLPVQKAG